MKRNSMFPLLGLSSLFLLFCSSCSSNDPVLTVSDIRIEVGPEGSQRDILVTSSGEWQIQDLPDWCEADKVGESDTLRLIIRENDTYRKRETTLTAQQGALSQEIQIAQEGVKKEVMTDNHTFYVFENKVEKNGTDYFFEMSPSFVNPDIRRQVYIGNIIDTKQKSLTRLSENKEFHYQPITMSTSAPLINVIRTITTAPTYEETAQFAKEIIESQPKQFLSFFSSNTPTAYYSHKELSLLGIGKAGTELDRLIAGSSYKEQEMKRDVGMLYTYNYTLFDITMDLPTNTAPEKMSSLSYIFSITYGKTGFLLVESDINWEKVNIAINKIAAETLLSDYDKKVLQQADFYYVHFNEAGEWVVQSGKEELIKQYNSGISKEPIVPLSFHVSNCKDNSEETITYQVPAE